MQWTQDRNQHHILSSNFVFISIKSVQTICIKQDVHMNLIDHMKEKYKKNTGL